MKFMEEGQNVKKLIYRLIKLGIIVGISVIFGCALYYQNQVILYDQQLNAYISYLYDDVSSSEVISVYQRMLNADSSYRERIKKDLEPALISRYQYYANLYMLRKIEYQQYLNYEQKIETLFFSSDKVIDKMNEVQKYYESEQAYLKGLELQNQGLIEQAIESYQEVMFNDEHYYELAKEKIHECIQSIKNQYLEEAYYYYEMKDYIEAIKRLDYLMQTDKDESISALKWYYQSEFYMEAMDVIDQFVEEDELSAAISYLEEISDSLSTQYAKTLELKKAELSVRKIKRRDQVMSQYATKIEVNLNAESNEQIITYNKISLQSPTSFNLASFAINTFTTVKNEVVDRVEEEQVEQHINVMPLLVTNKELTSATMSILFGHYDESVNEFEQVDIYNGNQLLYSFDIDSTQKQQNNVGDRVIEWVKIEILPEQVSQLLTYVQLTTPLSIVFRGPQRSDFFELETMENELLIMMGEIYQSIIK